MSGLCEENDRAFAAYLDAIRGCKPLSREEEQKLARAFRDRKDMHAREILITSNLRFVVKVAFEYRRYGVSIIDLVQEGNVGLVKAVKEFDPDRHIRLISYAVWWIRAFITNYIMHQWCQVKIGTTSAQRKVFYSVAMTRMKIARRDGIVPEEVDAERIARHLRVKRKDAEETIARMNGREVSLDRHVIEREDDSVTFLDMLEDPNPLQEATVVDLESRRRLEQRIFHLSVNLTELELRILRDRLMVDRDERQTLIQIGDEFDLSDERVRQIEKHLKERFRASLSSLAKEYAEIG